MSLRNVVRSWLFYTVFGALLLVIDPFGVGSYAEIGSQKVLYEIGGPFYASKAQNDITVVLVTEQSLKALYNRKITGTNEWPLLYRDWAVLLKTIAAYEPRSLFVDIYFEQERVTDSSLPSLESALGRVNEKVPIHFAAGIPPYDSELLQRLNTKAGLAGSTWQGFGHGIPLLQDNQPIAAMQLYRDACGTDIDLLPGCSTDAEWTFNLRQAGPAMSVVWGSRGTMPLTAELEGFSTKQYCGNNTTGLADLALGIVRSAAGDLMSVLPESWSDKGRQCLFHRVIDAEELLLVFDHGSESERVELKNALTNKIVLLGTSFEGLPDKVQTPAIGLAPGVAQHAMMLDNLMKYGPAYIRTAGWGSAFYNVAIWSAIVLVLVIWMALREEHFAQRKPSDPSWGNAPFTGWGSTVFFLVSLALTSFAAFSTFYFFRFEPANAIGFLGLAELTRRIYVKAETDSRNEETLPKRLIKNWHRWRERK